MGESWANTCGKTCSPKLGRSTGTATDWFAGAQTPDGDSLQLTASCCGSPSGGRTTAFAKLHAVVQSGALRGQPPTRHILLRLSGPGHTRKRFRICAVASVNRPSTVLLHKRYRFKNGGSCVDHSDYAHPLGVLGDQSWLPAAATATAQGIGGMRSSPGAWPPMVAVCRDRSAKARSPAKPGFRRSRKCAQMRFCLNLIYLFILCKEKHDIRLDVLGAPKRPCTAGLYPVEGQAKTAGQNLLLIDFCLWIAIKDG
jgi:hypothetical protein